MYTRKSLFAILVVAVTLNGCGNKVSPPDPSKSDLLISNQVRPDYEQNLLPPPAPTADPASAPMPDPMLADNKVDPLGGSDSIGVSDPLKTNDPLLESDSGTAENKNRPIRNWYWVRGSISHGSVTIKVNGTDIGNFAVHIDKEISDYVALGSNDITFVSTPTIPGEPVACDLKVIYSQQTEGAPPVLEYNSTADIATSPTAPAVATLGTTAPGTSSLGPSPVIQPGLSADGVTTKTLSFIAE